MARNTSTGTYTLPTNSFAQPVTGTTISPTDATTTFTDWTTEFTDSLSRSGYGAMLAGLKGYDGTVSLPGYTFGSDLDTGFYRIGANNIGLSLGGSKIVDWSSTTVAVTAGTTLTATSPNFTTPILGVAAATSAAVGGATIGSNALAVTGTSLFNSAVTIGAALTYGGVTLSNAVTGTGNMVLATTPTLTTPNIGVATGTSLAASGVLSTGANSGTNGQLTLNGSTSGSVTLKAAAAAGTGTNFQLPATNGTNGWLLKTDGSGNTSWIAASGTGDVLAANNGTEFTAATFRTNLGIAYGKHTIWVPASAMKVRTTNGGLAANTETSTNKVQIAGIDFDAATNQYAQFSVYMPKSYDAGTLTAVFVWEHPSTTTNFAVVWGVQSFALGDNTTMDTAFGTAQEVTDTGGTTNAQYVSAATSAMTMANTPAGEKMAWFQVYRNAASGSDTLAVNARLLGVSILYNTNANNDT